MKQMQGYMLNQVVKLAWPVVLEGTGIMLTGVFTTGMVGQLGAVSVGAVGLAVMVQAALSMIFGAAGTGSAAIVARECGAGNWPEVRRVAVQALWLGLVFGVIIGIAGYFLAPGLFFMIGADPKVAQLASQIVQIMFLFTPLYLVWMIGNNLLRGLGLTRLGFMLSLVASAVSLGASYSLIFGHGFYKIGVSGAAWAAGLSQCVGGLGVIFLIAVNKQINLRVADIFAFRYETVRRIIEISLPAAMEQVALQGGRITYTFMLAGISAVQFAAHQIALQVEAISFMPGFGLAVAAMTLVGQSLGKSIPHRAAQYAWLSNTVGFVFMSALGGLFVLFGKQLASLFIADSEVIYWGGLCVMIAALEQPTISITMVLGGALRGAGDTKWPMYITVIGVWLVRIPLIYFFIVVLHFDVTAAWYITALDFLVRSIILWRRMASNAWMYKSV